MLKRAVPSRAQDPTVSTVLEFAVSEAGDFALYQAEASLSRKKIVGGEHPDKRYLRRLEKA